MPGVPPPVAVPPFATISPFNVIEGVPFRDVSVAVNKIVPALPPSTPVSNASLPELFNSPTSISAPDIAIPPPL